MTEVRKRPWWDDPRTVWVLLGVAMVAAIAFILWMGRGTTLWADDVEYFAHMVRHDRMPEILDFGPRYIFAPFNGHLQVVGKVIYEAMYSVLGPNYFVFRLVEAVLWAACVGAFFLLARTYVGPGVSLVASVLLLFAGAGWEAMLWAFDLHTLIALLSGLSAFLVQRRGGRWADPVTFLLLLLSIGSIEIGLAFTIGIGVGILLQENRWRRIWVAAVPIVLYLAWTAWAGQYDQNTTDPAAVVRALTSVPASLASTVGTLTGLFNPSGLAPHRIGTIWPAELLAVVVAVLIGRRVSRGQIANEAWMFLATVLGIWLLVTIGARPPDQSRFVLMNGILLLLVAASLLADRRFGKTAMIGLCVLAVAALPTNMIKLANGRDYEFKDGDATRAEYAMLDLAGDRASPTFAPGEDALVRHLATVPFTSLTAGEYLPAAQRFGSLGYSLDELMTRPQETRVGADASLVGALGLGSKPSEPPPQGLSCRTIDGSQDQPATTGINAGATYVRGLEPKAFAIGLSRFSDEPRGISIGVARDAWSRLDIPADTAIDRFGWTLHARGALEVCSDG